MTLTGTRVPQDVLAHASTTLRWGSLKPTPHTIPQALIIQEQNNKTKQNGRPKQKTRPPYKTWTWKKPQNKMIRNKNEDNGRKKNGQVF